MLNYKLLEVKELKKYYPVTAGLLSRHIGFVKAVDGVTFHINQGETLGLVGESGCGKSTLGRTILGLEKPTDGKVIYQGIDITKMGRKELREISKEIQMIFQDPHSSLDPRMMIGDSIAEALLVQGFKEETERMKRVTELLEKVGLEARQATRYPHEFSGGEKQRIGIARALAMKPKLIIADEPVSALDVSIQAQILNLMMDLQEELKLTYLFIAHDLSVVRYISKRVAVMYLGKIVELSDKEEIFANPLHPYTKALLSAVPAMKSKIKRILLPGDIPSPFNPPPGCLFHPRCHRATSRCSEEEPKLKEVTSGHFVSCHLYNSESP